MEKTVQILDDGRFATSLDRVSIIERLVEYEKTGYEPHEIPCKKDAQAFFDKLLDMESRIINVSMLAEGAALASNGMGDREYSSMASGALNTIHYVLDDVYDTLNKLEDKFKQATGVKWPCEL